MDLLGVLITYLAIGSAFAMRAYFLGRRRSLLSVIGAVSIEFLFWLPLVAVRMARRARRTASSADVEPIDPAIFTSIDNVVDRFDEAATRKVLREKLERYSALSFAVSDADSPPSGDFEIFAIAGHLNDRTGTAALARRNAAKLRFHRRRSADDIMGGLAKEQSNLTIDQRSALMELFDRAGDRDSAAIAGRMPARDPGSVSADHRETSAAEFRAG